MTNPPVSAQSPDIKFEPSGHDHPSDIESKNITDDKMESAIRSLSLGQSHHLEDHCEVITNDEKARIVDKKDGNANQANVYKNQGDVFTASSKYKEAIENYEKAHNISPGLEVAESEMMAYQGFANNLLENGQYEQSIKNYNKVIEFAKKRGNKIRSNTNEKATKLYENASNVLETERNDVQYEKALIGLGIAWSNLRNTEKAIETIHKVQKFSRKKTDNVTGTFYNACTLSIINKTFRPKSFSNASITDSYEDDENTEEDTNSEEGTTSSLSLAGNKILDFQW